MCKPAPSDGASVLEVMNVHLGLVELTLPSPTHLLHCTVFDAYPFKKFKHNKKGTSIVYSKAIWLIDLSTKSMRACCESHRKDFQKTF